MNNIDIICFDLETTGLVPGHHEAIQVAGKAYSAMTLEPVPLDQGGEFCSLMRPLYFDRIEDGALRVNGKTREQLAAAPEARAVWPEFIAWVSRFNKRKNAFGAPIAAGKNIRNFDMAFVHCLNRQYGAKKEKTMLFSTRRQIELEDLVFLWFEGTQELPNEKMDTLRDYFGLPREGAHDALVDVRQTGELIMKFLRLHRHLQRAEGADGKLIKFKGACAPLVEAA